MKQILFALLLSLLAINTYAQGKKALDEKYGFREMKFESEVTAYPDLVALPVDNVDGPQRLYRRPDDEMKVGDAVLSEITYEFYKGKLLTVILRAAGGNNSLALQNALRAQHGPGSPPLKFTEESTWNSSKVHMYYRRNQFSGDSYVRISSKAMTKEASKGGAEAAKAAKADL